MKKEWDFGGAFEVCHTLLVCIDKVFTGHVMRSAIFGGAQY